MKKKIRNAFTKLRGSLTRAQISTGPQKQDAPRGIHPSSDQLRNIITQTKEQAVNALATLGKQGVNLQTVIDNADATLPLVPYMDPANIEGITGVWNEFSKQTRFVYDWLEEMESSTDTLGGTASLTSVTTTGVISTSFVHFESDPNFKVAWKHYNEVTFRPNLRSEVIGLLRTFHLDIAPAGKRSPLELFETAHNAFELPVSKDNPVITSLLPIREAIESTLEELLKLRPQQKATGKSHGTKILSICEQLKKDAISDVIVQEWIDQWRDISDKDLSASKRYKMSREEWSRKLNRATLFLHSLLTGLDPSKLRK